MRVFTSANLLQTVGAAITSDSSACDPAYPASNLVSNLDNRSCYYEWKPIIDEDATPAAYDSCLLSYESILSAHGHKFVLGFELAQMSFVN